MQLWNLEALHTPAPTLKSKQVGQSVLCIALAVYAGCSCARSCRHAHTTNSYKVIQYHACLLWRATDELAASPIVVDTTINFANQQQHSFLAEHNRKHSSHSKSYSQSYSKSCSDLNATITAATTAAAVAAAAAAVPQHLPAEVERCSPAALKLVKTMICGAGLQLIKHHRRSAGRGRRTLFFDPDKHELIWSCTKRCGMKALPLTRTAAVAVRGRKVSGCLHKLMLGSIDIVCEHE
jgi:hypothetical protein